MSSEAVGAIISGIIAFLIGLAVALGWGM